MRTLCLALAAFLLLAGAGTRAQDMNHEQALRALSHADAQKRRAAVDRLADVGRMVDTTALVKALRDPDDEARTRAEQALWRIWSRSGDKAVDSLFEEGLAQMSAGDADAALATFTRVIEMKPDFAEGWNKRATIYFSIGEMRKSLADCDQVLKRNPQHFGALAGYVLIYIELEQFERARDFARRALRVNPNMDGVRQNLLLIEEVLRERREKTV